MTVSIREMGTYKVERTSKLLTWMFLFSSINKWRMVFQFQIKREG